MKKVLSKKRRFEIFKRDNFTCMYCGKKPPEVKLSVDHKVAKAKGGTDDDANLITACSICNGAKGIIPLDQNDPYINSIRINMEVPDSLNDRRKNLKATWRDILVAGLSYLEQSEPEKKSEPKPFDPAIEDNLKLAVLHMQNAWKLIKKTK